MSKQATRYRKVQPSPRDIRTELNMRELSREYPRNGRRFVR